MPDDEHDARGLIELASESPRFQFRLLAAHVEAIEHDLAKLRARHELDLRELRSRLEENLAFLRIQHEVTRDILAELRTLASRA